MDDRTRSVVVASAAILAVVVERRRRRRSERQKRQWARPWIRKREQHGAYHCLLKGLELGDRPSYKNFLHR